jgi:hypothetical protein
MQGLRLRDLTGGMAEGKVDVDKNEISTMRAI